MATRKPTRSPARTPARRTQQSGSGGGAGPFFLGVLVTACVVAAIAFYFHLRLPRLPSLHPHARILAQTTPPPPVVSVEPDTQAEDRPKPVPQAPPPATAPHAPFPISEDVYEAGASLYVKTPAGKTTGSTSCATCHGSPNRLGAKPVTAPGAAEFFLPHSLAAHDPVTRSPSQLFVRTKYGVQGAPAMPAYAGTLTDRQIWQIALLLSHADEPLPDPVVHILNLHH